MSCSTTTSSRRRAAGRRLRRVLRDASRAPVPARSRRPWARTVQRDIDARLRHGGLRSVRAGRRSTDDLDGGGLTMALTNRDRIGKMFELLAPALDDFIATRRRPRGLAEGASWTDARGDEGQEEGDRGQGVRARSTRRCSCGCSPRTSRTTSSRAGTRSTTRSASVGQATRGSCARPATTGRTTSPSATTTPTAAWTPPSGCSTAIGAPTVADEVKAIRLGLRRLTADKDDRKVLKSAAVTPESAGLRPWREVLPPHDDVATGNFQAAEFAADLYKVAATRGRRQGLRRAGRVLRAHLPHRGPARPHRPRGAAPGRRRERLAGHQPADELRRRQDALDARAVAPGVGHAARRLPAGRPGAARARRLRRAGRKVRRVALVGNHISPVGLDSRPTARRSTRSGASSPGSSAARRRSRWSRRRTPTGPRPGEALHDLLAAPTPRR